MDVIQIDLRNRIQVKDFLSLPAWIYRQTPQWVPSLAGDERLRLNTRRYAFYKHSTAAFFLAYRNGQPSGRLAILDNTLYNRQNNSRTAFFYLFECVAEKEIAQSLFTKGIQWAKERGLDKVMGPRGFTALDGLGLLVKGHEHRPALGLPYNPPYYADLIESAGFEPKEDIVSGYLSSECNVPERIHELADRIRNRRGLHIACFRSRRQLRAALKSLKDLYNDALAGTADGIPLTDEELQTLANQMLWLADPKLIKIVMKDEQPVGFLLAYPDISAALQRTKGQLFPFGWITLLLELRRTHWININGAGMIEAYRGSGGTAILYSEIIKSIRENSRYRHCEVVQIGLENDRMQREMENFGVDFYKLHRLYQRNF